MPIEPKLDNYNFKRYYNNLGPYFARPTVRAYSMIIMSLFTASFLGYYAIRPTFSTISNLQKQIDDATFVDQKLQEKINALSQAQTSYENLKPDIPLVLAALPEKAEFPEFTKNVEDIATKSGATIMSLEFSNIDLAPKEATTGASQKVPIAFNLIINGEYEQLTNFVKMVSNFKRFITIDKMGFSENPGLLNEENKLNLNIQGETYYAQ